MKIQKIEYDEETRKVVRQCLNKLKLERREQKQDTSLRGLGIEKIRASNTGNVFPVEELL